MKKSFFLSLLCVCAGVVFAAETTSEQALAAANAWAEDNKSAFGDLGAPTVAEAQRDGAGKLLWWTVRTAKGGAVIVAPDSDVEPIISVLPRYAGSIPANSALYAMLNRDLPVRVAAIAVDRATNATKAVSTPVARAMTRAAAKWSRLVARDRALKVRALKTSSRALGAADEESKTVRDPALPATVVSIVDGFEYNGRFTHWNQSGCGGKPSWPTYFTNPIVYNYFTPHHAACGCVATAAAAGLQFFDVTPWPEKEITKTCTYNGVAVELTTKSLAEEIETALTPAEAGEGEGEEPALPSCWTILPQDLGGEGDWESTDPNTLSELQTKLLGVATYNAGVAVEMAYTDDESGAYTKDVATAYRDVFGFKDARWAGDMSPVQIDKLINNQVRCGAPVIMSIRGTPGGHAVLAVGYGLDADKTPLTRVFLGWGGANDAWYNLPTVDCGVDAAGKPTNFKFELIQGVITMIATNAASMAVCGTALDADGLPLANAEVVFPDGESVVPDANGYWARRVAPGAFQVDDTIRLDVYDEEGGLSGSQRALVRVGTRGLTTGSKTTGYDVEAAELAAALPAAINFRVYGKGALEVAPTPEVAQSFARETDKAILMISGTPGNAQYEALMTYVKNNADALAENFVLYLVEADAADLTLLPDGNPSFGVFDPNRFNAQAENLWSWYNGRLAYDFVPKASSSEEVVGYNPITGEEIKREIVYDPEWTDEEVTAAFENVLTVGAQRWNASVSGGTLAVQGFACWLTGFDVTSFDWAEVEIGAVTPAYAGLDAPHANVYTNGETVVAQAPARVTNTVEGVVYACSGWALYDCDVSLDEPVDEGDANEVSFEIYAAENLSLVWYWEPTEIYVDVTTRGYRRGAGTISPASGWYPYGETCLFVAMPAEGSEFVQWLSGDGTALDVQLSWQDEDAAFAINGPALSFTLLGNRALSLVADFNGGFNAASAPQYTLRVSNVNESPDQELPLGRVPSVSVLGEVVAYDADVPFAEQALAAVLATNAFTDVTGTTNWYLTGWTLGYEGDEALSDAGTVPAVNVHLITNATIVLHWKSDAGEEPVQTSFNVVWNGNFNNLHTNYTTNLLSGLEYQRLLAEGKSLEDLTITVPTGWKAETTASPAEGVTTVLTMDEEVLRPEAGALTIEAKNDGTVVVSAEVANGAAGFWYTLFATDELGGSWTAVAAGAGDTAQMQPQQDGTVTLQVTLDAVDMEQKPRRFFKLVVTDVKP